MHKKSITCVFLWGISLTLCAQRHGTSIQFPSGYIENFRQSIFVDLDRGNTLRVDVFGAKADITELKVDSLISELASCIERTSDSFAEAAYVRKVTVNLYSNQCSETIFKNLAPEFRHLLVAKNTTALLKTEQDTVIMNLYSDLPEVTNPKRFYRLSFYLNDILEIADYSDKKIDTIIRQLLPYDAKAWITQKNGVQSFKDDPHIQLLKGYDPTQHTTALTVNFSLSVQTYRNHIVPSVSPGIAILRRFNYIEQQYWLFSETHFLFGRNIKGDRKTFSNNFLTLGYKRVPLNLAITAFVVIEPNFSVGYLINRKGDIYDKHTIKIQAGQFYIGRRSLRIEPTVYFHDIFRDAVPSLRITQSF